MARRIDWSRTKRVMITLPIKDCEQIQEVADNEFISFSAAVLRLLRKAASGNPAPLNQATPLPPPSAPEPPREVPRKSGRKILHAIIRTVEGAPTRRYAPSGAVIQYWEVWGSNWTVLRDAAADAGISQVRDINDSTCFVYEESWDIPTDPWRELSIEEAKAIATRIRSWSAEDFKMDESRGQIP